MRLTKGEPEQAARQVPGSLPATRNFVVDVLYSLLDPRERLGGAAAAH